MNPRVRKSLVSAINTVLASLPADVRQLLRGRWRWTVAPLRHYDGQTVAMATPNGVITFDPDFVLRLMDADAEGALEAMICHELAHVYHNLTGVASPDAETEELAANQWITDLGFAHGLRQLRKASGF